MTATPVAPPAVGAERAGIAAGVLLWLYLLTPYFQVGGAVINGGLVALAGLALIHPAAVPWLATQRWLYGYGLLFSTMAVYTSFVASLYGFSNTAFSKALLSIDLYMAFGAAYGSWLFRGHRYSFQEAFELTLRVVLVIIVCNCVLITVSYFIPGIKQAIEDHLANTSNIIYRTHAWRARGLSSTGGASLALLHGLGVWIALALFARKRIGVWNTVFSIFIIAASMVFVGRTGYVVILMAFAAFAATSASRGRVMRGLALAMLLLCALVAAFQIIASVIPVAIQQYAFQFLSGGVGGIQNDHTVSLLRSDFFLPDSALHLLFGVGNPNGGNPLAVGPDPGYMKTLLGLGLPLGLLLYAAILYFMLPMLRYAYTRGFVIPLVAILLVVEGKEPFLYQGYAGRLLLLLGGLWLGYRHGRRQIASWPSAAVPVTP